MKVRNSMELHSIITWSFLEFPRTSNCGRKIVTLDQISMRLGKLKVGHRCYVVDLSVPPTEMEWQFIVCTNSLLFTHLPIYSYVLTLSSYIQCILGSTVLVSNVAVNVYIIYKYSYMAPVSGVG